MDEDSILLRRMGQGDEDAIESFVRKYYAMILRYCRLHLEDHHEAEDITQETFARFFQTLPQYRHYGKAANYLYVIAGNLCRDNHRKIRPLSLEALPEEPQEQTEALETLLDVRRALALLPPQVREVAVLYYGQALRQHEIARILGISLPLVKYRLRRARELLALTLREEEKDEPSTV